MRSADKEVISALGRDWVEWLKNDEIRCKLNAWRKEEIEVSEKHYDLMRVITSSQKADMSLLQVLAVVSIIFFPLFSFATLILNSNL